MLHRIIIIINIDKDEYIKINLIRKGHANKLKEVEEKHSKGEIVLSWECLIFYIKHKQLI